ncbi:MAG: hypothetical protein ACP5O7_11605, partial [Phycisphaerae bacterium]
ESGWYSTSNPVDVYGVGPTGPSSMACSAYDEGSGTSQSGSLPVTVQNEYVKAWTSETDGPAGSAPTYSATLIPPQAYAAAGQGITVTVTAGSSVDVEVGVSVSGDIPGTDFGLEVGMSTATESIGTSSVNVTCPASPSATLWEASLVPMIFTVEGTGYEYDPNGVNNQEPITEIKQADPLADAENMSNQTFAFTPPSINVTPVTP